MAVKIRLARRGRKKKPFYHIIIADGRSPRDGRFIEKIGSYNPLTKPATIEVDREKAFAWMQKGAIPTDTVRSILRFKGVMFRMHLQKGVRKEALTQEQADKKYLEYINEKDARIAKRFEEVRKAKDEMQRKVAGTDMPIKIADIEVKKSETEEE